MKLRLASVLVLALFCLMAVAPVFADTLVYDDGFNGNIDAWTINFGFQNSNTFSVSQQTNLTYAQVYLWMFPGDVPLSTDWEIGTTPGSSNIASGVGSLFYNTTFLFTNQYGYNIYSADIALNTMLAAGNYWFSLQNAFTPSGDPIYWDQGNGPSTSWNNVLGYNTPANGVCFDPAPNGYCNQSFQLYGTSNSGVPEPASLFLLGSGLFGLANVARKRVKKA